MVLNHDLVVSAYDAVVSHEFNWLLLHYSEDHPDELELYSYGSEGLEELKANIYDLEAVFIAFHRDEAGFVIINYIPTTISPVRRARALVHSRHSGTIFKMHQTMLTIDNLSQLTTSLVHKAITNPRQALSIITAPTLGTSFSVDSEPPPRSGPTHSPPSSTQFPNMVRRSFSETYAPQYMASKHDPPPVPPVPQHRYSPKSSGMLGGFLRRKGPKKTSRSESPSTTTEEDDLPPPIPPKDDIYSPSSSKPVVWLQHSPPTRRSPPPFLEPSPTSKHPGTYDLSELGVITSQIHDQHNTVIIAPPVSQPRTSVDTEWRTLPLKGKWARDASISDPKQREARRRELQRQRELEEQIALEEEMQRQEEAKRRKEEEKRREEEEEAERKLSLEEELRRIAMERERKRREEEEEERRIRREIEERKRLDRERRLEEHRKLEKWRHERERALQQEARRSEEAREREEQERQRKIQQAEKLVVQAQAREPTVKTGWVTIQFNDSLFWKRRYYRFSEDQLLLYRSPKEKDVATPLEVVEVKGKVSALKEWKDGYEELKAIPFSFVVEFNDERQAWSMFSDSEREKFLFLGLLTHASGL